MYRTFYWKNLLRPEQATSTTGHQQPKQWADQAMGSPSHGQLMPWSAQATESVGHVQKNVWAEQAIGSAGHGAHGLV
jgi:hypothetical protein